MKRTAFSFIILLSIISCKKTNNGDSNTTNVDTTLPGLGGSQAAAADVVGAFNMAAIDTSLLPNLLRVTGSSFFIDAPEPDQFGQGKTESCVGWAVGYGTLSYIYKRLDDVNYDGKANVFSPSFIYNQIKQKETDADKVDHYNAKIPDALKLLVNTGGCKWPQMPFTLDKDAEPSPAANLEASDNKIFDSWGYWNEALSIFKLKALLAKGYPLPALFKIDLGFQNDDPQSFISVDGEKVWKNSYGKSVGLHAMVLIGYDDTKNAFKLLNSWGTLWGNKGFIWVDYDYFTRVVSEWAPNQFDIYQIIPWLVSTKLVANDGVGNTLFNGQVNRDPLKPNLTLVEKGFCFGKGDHPTINDNKVKSTNTIFDSYLISMDPSNFEPQTKYFVRAYAILSDNRLLYGKPREFTSVSTNNNNNFSVTCDFIDANGSPFATLGLNLTVNNGIVNGTIVGATPTALAEVTGTITGSQMQLKIHTNNNYTTCSIDANGNARYNIDETYDITGTTDSNLSFYNATFQYSKVSGSIINSNPCMAGPNNVYNVSGTCSW